MVPCSGFQASQPLMAHEIWQMKQASRKEVTGKTIFCIMCSTVKQVFERTADVPLLQNWTAGVRGNLGLQRPLGGGESQDPLEQNPLEEEFDGKWLIFCKRPDTLNEGEIPLWGLVAVSRLHFIT